MVKDSYINRLWEVFREFSKELKTLFLCKISRTFKLKIISVYLKIHTIQYIQYSTNTIVHRKYNVKLKRRI